MRKQSCAFFIATVFYLSIGESSTFAKPSGNTVTCQVAINSGVIAGSAVGESCVYLGIPYANAPTGARRWRAPEPAVPWSGIRDAVSFGNICPQLQGAGVAGDEDCLNLNVFAPAGRNSPLPVMVFLHGGGNRTQSNRAEGGESLDGLYLAEKGSVIVVTINFRLGALGWLAHPLLDAESDTGSSGNYGILDQIAALRWVQRNIRAFDGDPDRVTLTGHSAGAQDVGILLASPLARGLFAGVLIDGAGPLNFSQKTLSEYEADTGIPLTAQLGCATTTCLRGLPAATIVSMIPGQGDLKSGSTFQPILDSFVLRDTVLETVKHGEHNHVPIVIGGTKDESSYPAFVATNAIPTDDAYRSAISDFFGPTIGDEVLALYPTAAYATPRSAYIAATTDYKWICPARRLSVAAANSQKEPIFRFLYTHSQSNPPAATSLGSWHGQELMFIFHSFTSGVSGPFTPTPDELAMSDHIIGYWGRFAATGNPNGKDAPAPWFDDGKNANNNGKGNNFFLSDAQGNAKKDLLLVMDTTFQPVAGFHARQCDFWDNVLDHTNNGHGIRR